MLKVLDICNFECIKDKTKRTSIINDIKRSKLNWLENHPLVRLSEAKLFYSPVGNYPPEPIIIICGKATSKDSKELFWEYFYKTDNFHIACLKSPYSNMKDNLFIYLYEIGLFGFLSKLNSYWADCCIKEEYKKKWDEIFKDFNTSLKSGIQITQAINCAIINNDTKMASSQPSKKIIDEYKQMSNCFFKGFRITKRLELIIFLDTPSNTGFHQINLFKKQMPDLIDKVISITHPSNQNWIVYKNLENRRWNRMGNKGKNAKLLFNNASSKIKQLKIKLDNNYSE